MSLIVVNTVKFTLARPLPLLNVQLRTHWAKRRKQQKALAKEVGAMTAGRRPELPFHKAKVTVERHSLGVPDDDNINAKALLDVLCPQSATHPFGLGIISDDNPSVCKSIMVPVKVSRRADQKTVVTVEAIA